MTVQPPAPPAGPPAGPPDPDLTRSGAPPAGSPAAPPTPWWAAVLMVLGVLVVVGALLGAVGAVVTAAATRTQTGEVAADGVRTLRIVGATGAATIDTVGAVPGGVSGLSRATTSWQDATMTATQEGSELVLRAECPDQGWPRSCSVTYDLLVDPAVDVVVDLATGGLEADGLAGDVDVSMTAGGVLLTGLTSERVQVDITTGGAALTFSAPPRDVHVTTTTGGVGIQLPDDGTAYDVTTSVSVGDAGVRVPVDATSSRTVAASTTVGGIQVGLTGQPPRRTEVYEAPSAPTGP